MSRQQSERPETVPEVAKESGESSAIKPIQVAAAALAAITAAFLGSSLGVYGTVLGAGLISVATTIGSEIYLRSLRRTKEAARRTRLATARIDSRTRRQGTVLVAEPVSAEGDKQDVEQSRRTTGRFGKLRWPLIIGTSVLAFVIGMLMLTGFELTTGKSVSGGDGSTVGRIVGGGGGGNQGSEPPDDQSAETNIVVPTTEPSQTPVEATSEVPSTETTAPESSVQPERSQPSQTPTSAPPSSQSPAPSAEPSGGASAEPPGGE